MYVKKFFVLILPVMFSFMLAFSESYQYYIYQNDAEIGNIIVEFDVANCLGKTTSILNIGENTLKFVSETKYDDSWTFQEYSLEIFVDNQKQGTLVSTYNGKKVTNQFNGINLKNYNVENVIILDNNFILDHIFALYYKNLPEGKYSAFVPQLSLNQTTWNNAILDVEIEYKDPQNLVILFSGLAQNVAFQDGKITKVEIPSQSIEVTMHKKEQKAKNYVEKEIIFDSFDGFKLEGSLMIPKEVDKNKKSFGIVLVHGSGPLDRNETIGTLTPFLHLSEGLVEEGYIVLKYDKRNFTMAKNGQNFSKVMPEAFIKDAQAAIRYLKTLPEVDKEKIIVIGHSQGASFLPYIIEGEEVFAAVTLSPALLEITDQIVYQVEYQINYYKKHNTDNSLDSVIKKLEDVLTEAKKVNESMKKGEIDPNELYLDYYSGEFLIRWSELSRSMVEKFVNMNVPLLIINGTQDLKTPYELLKEYEKELKKKNDLEIVYIENMAHELVNFQTLKFEDKVVDQIALWLESQGL